MSRRSGAPPQWHVPSQTTVAHAVDFAADDALRARSLHAAQALAQRQLAEEQLSRTYLEQAQAAAAGPPVPTPDAQPSPSRRRRGVASSAGACPGGEDADPASAGAAVLDRHNPVVAAVLSMARTLGVDATQEYFLLPIAIQALAAPEEWMIVNDGDVSSGERYELRRPDLSHFQAMVHAARLRARHSPPDNTPWIRITEAGPAPASSEAAAAANTSAATSANAIAASASPTASSLSASPSAASTLHSAGASSASLMNSRTGELATHSYWYNFKTQHRSPVAPPLRSGLSQSDFHASGRSATPELTVMRFSSSFSDPLIPGARRQVRVAFHLASEEFEITLVPPVTATCDKAQAEASALVYRVKNLRTKHGPASCWDLHVGAILDVFGRQTTLSACDAPTRLWIETNARRLRQVRAALASKLAKYTPLSASRAGGALVGSSGGTGATWAAMAASDSHSPPLVESHLRALMKDVSMLKNELAKYRPALAEKYAL